MGRWFSPSPFRFLFACAFLATSASALEVTSLLKDGQLPPEWKISLGAKSGGSIAPAMDGLLLQSEPRQHGLIRRDSDTPGTDTEPLDVSVRIATAHESERTLWPALYLYWDDTHYTGVRMNHEGHVWSFCMSGTQWREQGAWGALKVERLVEGKKWREGSLRVRLLSRTALLFYSGDGVEWERVMEIARPDGGGKNPTIILGRGAGGDPNNKETKSHFSNDVQPDGNKTLVKTLLASVRITNKVTPLPALGNVTKQDTWEQTLAGLEAAGIPRQWTFAGPLTLNDGQRKQPAPPDANDDWNGLKDAAGQPIKTVAWTRPEEETPDGFLDLADHLGAATQVAGWARTEVTWPEDGEALLWYASVNPIALYVNNRRVMSERDDHDQRPQREKRCVRVLLNKGRNIIKLRLWQSRGDWSYFLRLERNDPAYRITLLEKMLEFFPGDTGGWRAVAAQREIARSYEEIGNYPQARASYEKMLAQYANQEEHRIGALLGQLRILELLRDGSALKAAGEAFLTKFSRTPGAAHARRAVLVGSVLAGQNEEAFKSARAFANGADEDIAIGSFRSLAGILQSYGHSADYIRALEELSALDRISSDERVRAAMELANALVAPERERAWNQKPNPERLTAACKAYEKVLALLPGAKSPGADSMEKAAAADLKAGNFDPATAGYWGACLLALAASDSDLAPLAVFSKPYNITRPEKDGNNKIEDANVFRRVFMRSLQDQMGDPLPTGKWRVVSFSFEAQQTFQTAFPPEQNPNAEDYGNNRRWQNMDVDVESDWELFKGANDQGIDLNRWAEQSDVAYVQREIEVKKDTDTQLFIAAPAGWAAWVDGKPVGANLSNKGFRLEKNRLAVKLSPGKHKVMLKLESPANGPFNFRARLGAEPEVAMYLYVQAQTQLQLPRPLWERRRDLGWVARDFLPNKAGMSASVALYDTIVQAFSDSGGAGVEFCQWVSERYRESGDHDAMVSILRKGVARIEATADYQGRARQAADLRRRLAIALVAAGQVGAADGVLRELAYKYVDDREYYYSALSLRGSLRRDGGQSHTALPYFEEVVRDNTNAPAWDRQAWNGVDWARNFRPERLILETPHEVQATLEAVRRQLNAGGAEDIDRAMRNVNDVLQGAAGSLSRVVDSPFFARYVGVREYVRAMLEGLPQNSRDVYAKVVKEIAQRRINTATALGDAAALEMVANDFHSTPLAVESRKAAGNLYLDRGQFAQAVSSFQALLRGNGISKPETALALVKLARAQTGNGQFAAAGRTLDRLKSEFGGEQVPFGGKPTAAASICDRLRQQVDEAQKSGEPAQRAAGAAAVHLGNLLRTGAATGPTPEPGPVTWAHSLIPQSAMAQARGAFDVEIADYAPSQVAASNNIAYVGGLESIRAIEISSGRMLWSHAWGSGTPLVRNGYNGYPISCPTLNGGRIYMRALESGVSSLRCYSAKDGQLLWNSAAAPELRPVAWIGEPAVAYGLVYAVYLEPGDMNMHGVAALDAQSGRLRWKAPLVTGNTGIKITDRYYMSTLHLGPPAIDGGELFIATGMASIAAINAFSGEVKWLSAYPRLYFGDPRSGQSSAGIDLLLNTAKTFARGPLSPMLDDEFMFVAPKDSANVYCFRRQTGERVWTREMAGCRFLGGLIDGQLLVCDAGVQSLDVKTGNLLWENSLDERAVIGQPCMSGGVLYVPTSRSLVRMDAKTGAIRGETAWDPRIGAMGSVVVAGEHVLGTTGNVIAALGPKNASRADLPLYEARELEAAGNFEGAQEKYKNALQNKDAAEFLTAFTARLRLLEKLGRKDEIKVMLDELEKSGPTELVSFSGLWRIRRDVYLNAVRSRVLGGGQNDAKAVGDLGGTFVYAGEISGENPLLCRAANDANDRVFALAGNDVLCLKGGPSPEILWRAYAGPGVKEIRASGRIVAAMTELRIVLLDTATGEQIGEVLPPSAADLGLKKRVRVESRRFSAVAPGDNAIVAMAGELLCAWDASSGKLLWFQRSFSYKPQSSELFIANDRLLALQPYKDERKNQTILMSYDVRTGIESGRVLLGPRGWGMQGAFSPDGSRVAYRCENRVICADTAALKVLWNNDGVPRLEARGSLFDFQDNLLRYSGHAEGRWQAIWYDRDSGKEARPRVHQGAAMRINGEFLSTSGEWGRRIARERMKGNEVETVWAFEVSLEQGYHNHHLLAAIPAPDRVHLLYGRDRGGAYEIVLRTYGWESGQLLNEQSLPGTAMWREDGTLRVQWRALGGTAAITTNEGIMLFTTAPGSTDKIGDGLRQRLNDATMPAGERYAARRALNQLGQPEYLALLAPAELRIDANHSEWQGMDPIELKNAADFAPSGERGVWKGPNDLSARVFMAWNADGLSIAADVTDDTAVISPLGEAGTSGDGLRVAINSRGAGGPVLDRNNDLAFTLAWRDGHVGLVTDFSEAGEDARPIQAQGTRLPNGRGYRYEILVPWELIRRETDARPGPYRDIRLGVAVLDDDGDGVKGAMELGAGILQRGFRPQWMPRVTMLDISSERIERYRKVIEKVPDSQEAYRFLELIQRSKRGNDAEAERAVELEKFVELFPTTQNAARALGLLRQLYTGMGEQNVQGRLDAFMNKAKVPTETRNLVLNSAIKFWVYPDPKSPPQQIMIQFARDGDWPWRAYWGTSSVNWGREGTRDRWRMGNMPKAGEWTELTIYPADFGMFGNDIKQIAFTNYGGNVYFDRFSATIGGKETVLLDDQLMEKGHVDAARLEFVDNPKRHGAKAFIFRRHNDREPLLNPMVRYQDGKALISVTGTKPPDPKDEDRTKKFQTFREVARLIPETQEGWNFLQWSLDYLPGEGKDREKKKIEELKTFLKESPNTPNGVYVLKRVFDIQNALAEGPALAVCEAVMQDARLPRDTRRGFYTEVAPVWSEWHVIGPFAGLGERRGMDIVMDPERAVDLQWKTMNAGNLEVSWKKISNTKDDKGKPQHDPVVDLKRHLQVKGGDVKGSYFGYAYTKFNVPQKRKALLFFGAKDMVSIWLNGKRVVNEIETDERKDRNVQEVTLRSGENEILIKVGCQRDQRLGFVFRLADVDGKPFTDVTNE